MKLRNLMMAAFAAVGTVGCSEKPSETGYVPGDSQCIQTFMPNGKIGYAVISNTGSTEWHTENIREQREDYVWGDALKAEDPNPTGLGLNVFLENGEIDRCEVASDHGEIVGVYYPRPMEPTGMK